MIRATPFRWLLPPTQRKETSGYLAVRCYNVIILTGNTYVPLSQYTGEGGYYHTILSTSGKSFFLNLGASALLGYETVKRGNRLLYDGASLRKYESFIYGGAVTLEAERYLSDKIALLLRLRERFVWGGASGQACHFQYGAGVKYIF